MVRLSRQQVREVDRISIEKYHVPGVVLMENAARAVADAAIRMISRDSAARVLILCGGGNNGGDGMAAARHLHNRGYELTLCFMTDPAKYTGDALVQWEIVQAMKLPQAQTFDEVESREFELVIDAIFGTGLSASPRPPAASVIERVNARRWKVLAVDLPSGMDCDTGEPLGICIKANETVTFVAEKAGFENLQSFHYTGLICVGNIGCPREVIEEVLRSAR